MFLSESPSRSGATALLLAVVTVLDAAFAPASFSSVHLLLLLPAAAYTVMFTGRLLLHGRTGQDLPRLLCCQCDVAAPLKGQEREACASTSSDVDQRKEVRQGDPLRWSFIPSTGTNLSHGVYEHETDLCFLRMYIMGRPAHDSQRVADGDFPSAWHFEGRRRMWEVRMQLRFKQLPKGPLFLGLEYTTYQKMSAFIRGAEAFIVASASRILGGPVYKSPGDDPAEMGDAEAEPPCGAVPVYAFNQLIVSDVGEEPDITSNFEGLGWLRADGIAAYRRQVEATIGSPSIDKVYTLCTWSGSRMMDIMTWTLGIPDGLRVCATKLSGAPPTIGVLYDLADAEGSEHNTKPETRHLISRKRYYARFAFWSTMRPPKAEHLRKVLQLKDTDGGEDVKQETSSGWANWRWLEDWSQLFCCVSPRD